MHAWLCENPVGVDALTWKELPTPTPRAGEVLVEIHAASLNFPDLLIVQNKYQMKPPLPFVPGSEYAGIVEAFAAIACISSPIASGGAPSFGCPPSIAVARDCKTRTTPPRARSHAINDVLSSATSSDRASLNTFPYFVRRLA